ncbi:hypothetical protein O6H91_03G076300 [Diphasiastrum complanatum]|uniref:Uncharacterized protein n=1 Tax=Diphasiastrum complanatum TaxID=34168 RepID=A0ACC2E877_DIPCM|nr:hypothetical protein O6H91_03G076300 [Diphasiastrum complanatum]
MMVDSQVSSATIQLQPVLQKCKTGGYAASRPQASAGRQGGLKINKESKRIKKLPQPLQIQAQQPLIIHTHSPRVIQADSRDFMWLVQRLTGSPATRLRCEQSKPSQLPNLHDKAEAPLKSMPGSSDASNSGSVSDTYSHSEADSYCPGLESEVSFCQTSKPSANNHTVTEELSTSTVSLTDSASSMDFDSECNDAAPSMRDSWDEYETEAFVSSLPSPSIFSAIFLHELPALSLTACSYMDFLDSSVAPNCQFSQLEHCQA